MTFTNNDLKRLKQMTEEMKLWPPNPLKIQALLARLEASERYGEYCSKFLSDKKSYELYRAWRKAAGK